jgi:hypothetical protein
MWQPKVFWQTNNKCSLNLFFYAMDFFNLKS